MIERIGRMCLALREGAIVVTFTTELTPGPGLVTVRSLRCRMSWGFATAYIHKRVPAPSAAAAAEAATE